MKKSALFSYAIRSIVRQKTRNFFITLIVCLTCVFSLFTASLFEGKNAQIKENIIETETGNWQIIEKNFFEKFDPFSPAKLSPELAHALNNYVVTPEILTRTTILHPEGAQELTLIGIEPESHEHIFKLKSHVSGKWPLDNLHPREIVIGRKFANKLNVDLGDEVVITYQDQNRAILNESLKVVGIYQHYGPGFEGHHAYVARNDLLTLLNLPIEQSFHRLIINPKEIDAAPELQLPENLILKRWNDLHPELDVMMRFHQGVTRALVIFMLVMAYVSIMTPVNILWEERKDEITVLQTLGASRKVLYLTSALEALMLTVISLVMAFTIWGVLVFYGIMEGYDFSIIGEKEVVRGGILIPNIVHPVIDWTQTFLIVFFHGVIIFGCNFLSIKKLLKKEVVSDER